MSNLPEFILGWCLLAIPVSLLLGQFCAVGQGRDERVDEDVA